MGCSSFKAETKILINGRAYILKKKINDDLWHVQDPKDLNLKEFSEIQLQELYVSGELLFEDGLVSGVDATTAKKIAAHEFSEAQWEQLRIKRAYVIKVLHLSTSELVMKKAIQEVWEKIKKPPSPPNWSTVSRWKAKYIASGHDIRSLGIDVKKRGNRSGRYPDEVLQFVEDGIDTFYMTREQKKVEAVTRLIQAQVNRENDLRPEGLKLPLPKIRLVRRLIHDIPAFDRHAARHGRIAALKKFRSVIAHRITLAPLWRAEIDHTQLDLMVVDENGFPRGRPWVTACIDDYSRCILGIIVGFEPPNYHTVAQCLKMAFLPKVFLKKDYPSILNDWIAYGVMRELVVDNGAEFHSESLENACYSLGIEIHYSARKTPWFKGKIERFLGMLNSEIAHGHPGTTFSNIFDKEEYDPVKHAVIRYSVFKEVMYKWVADVYHQRPHHSLDGNSPASFWINAIDPSDIPLPDNTTQLDALLGKTEHRVLTHKGIELNGLFYNSNELGDLRRRLGDKLKVDIRIDDSNLGSIVVLSPDKKQIYTVPALKPAYANGLSSFQHKICKRYAQNRFGRNDVEAYLEAQLAIQEIISKESSSGRKKQRQSVARYVGDGNTPVAPKAPLVLPAPQVELYTATSSSEHWVEPSQKKIFDPIVRIRNPLVVDVEKKEGSDNDG
jgi:putative transposase